MPCWKMGSSIRFYDRGAIMAESLDNLFSQKMPSSENIVVVIVDKTANKVIQKISAHPDFYANMKKLQDGEALVIAVDDPYSVEVGYDYIPD
jgi:TusA-related sulfurtransferase